MKVLQLLFLLIAINSNGQDKPVFENDTLSYKDQKFYVGQEVKLSYGSTSNKDFAFVYSGSGMSGVTPAPANFAKSTGKIDKVYKQQGKYFFRAKVEGSGKIFVDIEGAVDNKEL